MIIDTLLMVADQSGWPVAFFFLVFYAVFIVAVCAGNVLIAYWVARGLLMLWRMRR